MTVISPGSAQPKTPAFILARATTKLFRAGLDFTMTEASVDHIAPSPVSDSDESGQDDPWSRRPGRRMHVGLQEINSRFVPDPGMMFVQLRKTFGEKNFMVTVLFFVP